MTIEDRILKVQREYTRNSNPSGAIKEILEILHEMSIEQREAARAARYAHDMASFAISPSRRA